MKYPHRYGCLAKRLLGVLPVGINREAVPGEYQEKQGRDRDEMNRLTGGARRMEAEEREAGKDGTAKGAAEKNTERTAGRGPGLFGLCGSKASACALIFFVLLFLYGCFAFNDYGISVDENVERNTCLVTYKHLFPSVADIVTDSVNFPEIEGLDTYTDRYYGVAVQLPTVAVEHMFGFRLPLRTVYLIRHFYTFLLFYGAVAVFYFLVRRLTGSRWGALFGAVMLVLSPRMLAESFYNIKDIVFLSFVVYNLYTGVCFLDRPAVKNGIVLAAVSALCINVRVVGAVVLASCLFVGFLKGLMGLWETNGNPGSKGIFKTEENSGSKGMRFVSWCLLLLMVLIVSIGIYILSLPVLWKNPAAELANTVKTFSNFTNWDDIFLYRGFAVRGNNLPRSYLFVWIFISTPVLYLALFGLGITERFAVWAGELAAVARRKKNPAKCPELWRHIFFGMVLAIPLCYVVLRKPTLYNGWRHFYFLYAVIMLYAVYGALFLWRLAAGWDERRRRRAKGNAAQTVRGAAQKAEQGAAKNARQKGMWFGMWGRHLGKIACIVFLAASMAVTFTWMIKNHPYEYMYFNPLVRNYALHNFELDYWAVSEADMFRYICGHDDREEIRVWCTFSDYYKSLQMLPGEDQDRLVYADTPMEADYAVCRDLMKTSIEQMERQFAFEEVHSVVVDGRVINSVFRRTDDAVMKSVVARRGDGLFCNGDGAVWKPEHDPQGTALVSDLGREISLTKISVRHENQSFLDGLQFYVSLDGQNWKELSPAMRNADYILYSKKAVFQGEGSARYLKLAHRDGLLAEDLPELDLEIELYADRENPADLAFPPMIERVTGHENPVASALAVDGSLMTRWQSEDVQRQGIAFDIVLNDLYTISGVRLDTGESSNEYPRALRIFATEDEAEWAELPVESDDQVLFTFPKTQVKALRLLTGNMDGMDVGDRWSIYEISLMRRAE